jgi:hypothetical protein
MHIYPLPADYDPELTTTQSDYHYVHRLHLDNNDDDENNDDDDVYSYRLIFI